MTDNNDDRRRPRSGRSEGGRFDRSQDRGAGRSTGNKPQRDHRPEPARAEPDLREEPVEDRIAKVIARAGVASRRDAEAMIAEGRVTLNGAVLTSPAVNVTAQDRITVDGEPLPARERTRLWLYHKPRGLVTTARDPEGRPTVFENLPEDLPRVVAIGRLDINTEGLLLLTNDGGLAKVIAHPDTGWLRRYKVRAHGDVTQADLDKLRGGVTIDEMEYGPVEATLDRMQGDNVWITLGLREGKNREVKRILEHLGLQVNRLIRLSFGPFQLGDLEPGLVEEVKTKVLKEQLGATLAEAAGVDFESPVREPIAPFGSKKPESPRERDARPRERFDRDGGRFERDRDDERPRRSGDRPFRTRDERPSSGARDERAPPLRGAERRPTVWRAEDAGAGSRKGSKAPRRGADPKAERAALAERPRERIGAIKPREGRKVVVERLVSEPKPERQRPARKPAGQDAPRRPAPGGEDRPRRRDDRSADDRKPRGQERGDRPEGAYRRPRGEGMGGRGERAFEGEGRPARTSGGFGRARDHDDRPRRDAPRGDRPYAGPRGEGGRKGAGGGFGKGPIGKGPRGPKGGSGDRPERGPGKGLGPKGAGRNGPPRGRRS
jgi:23S rRNA pseudouridine2605 synthase